MAERIHREDGVERLARIEGRKALLEANRLVTKRNLGRQDPFLNRVEDLLDKAALALADGAPPRRFDCLTGVELVPETEQPRKDERER